MSMTLPPWRETIWTATAPDAVLTFRTNREATQLGYPPTDFLVTISHPRPERTAGQSHAPSETPNRWHESGLKKHAPRATERLTDAVFTALGEQTVVVVGTSAGGIVLPKLAEQLLSLRHQRDAIAAQVELRNYKTMFSVLGRSLISQRPTPVVGQAVDPTELTFTSSFPISAISTSIV